MTNLINEELGHFFSLLEGRTIKEAIPVDTLSRSCLELYLVFTDGTRLHLTEKGQAGHFGVELEGEKTS